MSLFEKLYIKLADYHTHNQSRIKFVLDLFEFLIVVVSILISYFIIKHFFNPHPQINSLEFFFFFIFLCVSWFVVSRITAMALIPRTQRYRTVFFQFVQGNFIIMLCLIAIKYIFGFSTIPLIFILVYISISLAATFLFRLTVFHFLKIYRENGYNLHHVLIIADAFSDPIIERLIKQKEWGFNINGIITKSRLIRAKFGGDINIYSDPEYIKTILDSNVIDEVIYCRSFIDEGLIKKIVDICNEVGIIFRLQSSISPLEPLEIQLKTLSSSSYLTLVDTPSNKISLIIKNVTDIYFSLLSLILLSPLFLLIAILIRIDSKGPIFFKQERIGLRGRKFKLIKFRTMVSNAEALLDALKEKNEMDGPAFKMRNDPRITRLGWLLRKTNMDELPQLYNVLVGEMSLIGPRPPLEAEVKKYERWQLRRLSVKPGITCSWQVIPNRNDVKFENWMLMDLKYIDNWSLAKDFLLFLKTINTIFFATGR